DAVAPGLDESVRPGEPPRDYVLRVAVEKAAAGARLRPGALVLAADTSVVLGDRILGKPAGEAEAREMVRALSGRRHSVLTGVALDGAARASAVVETAVWFRPLSEAEIAWYASTGEPLDKAGAYAIQGVGGVLVQRVQRGGPAAGGDGGAVAAGGVSAALERPMSVAEGLRNVRERIAAACARA